MNMDKRVLRVGAAVILCALVLRLLGSGLPSAVVQALGQPEVASAVLFLQTGRVVRLQAAPQLQPPVETVAPTEADTEPAQPVTALSFSAQDASSVSVQNHCGYDVDIPALLKQPLSWELTGDEPTVLILHTHGTEAYRECSGYRSQEESENVVSIGDHVAALLEAAGIQVIHDRVMHDQPSYNGSYNHARTAINAYLDQYPSIRLVLDIHRDAAEKSNGQQIDYTVQTPAGEAAQVMLVVGTDAGGLTHPNWQDNMALAVKLHARLEQVQPGICRPISFRSSRFNQDLSTGAVLMEMGAAGNTHEEAMLAAGILAQSIVDLSHGANR